MLWIESVNGIPIGMKTNTEGYNRAIRHTNEVIRNMSDWMVRMGDAYQVMQDRWAAKRPICAYCGEHITDEEAVYLNGEWICMDCIEEHTKQVEEEDFSDV